MFKKLRIQFVAIIMASVAVVLAIVFSGICLANYKQAADEVENALTSSIERADEGMRSQQFGFGGLGFLGSMMGDMPFSIWRSGDAGSGPMSGNDAEDEDDEDDADDGDESAVVDAPVQGFAAQGKGLGLHLDDDTLDEVAEQLGFDDFDELFNGPRIGGPRDEDRASMVPVAVYALDSSGQLQLVSGFATATLDQETLESAWERLADAADGSGTLGDIGLHYKKQTTANASYVAFADTESTSGWHSLAVMLLVAGLGVLVVFFFIALGLSNWALRPVREAWDSQRQFVADASHDLKTPLTVILANTSILMKHPESTIAAESQWIESTQLEAQQMQGLVNEMLELAQVEAGQQVPVVHESIDFSDLVDGETLLFDSVALERECAFDCRIEPGIWVSGNGQQLHKMVSTLVENAFKYVDDGGRIDVKLDRAAQAAVLEVRNTGSVISPEDLPHIFDRFYRTDKARTSGAGGFGLGLAIAREIARSHGGDITCESSASSGTCFTVTLPCQ